MPSNYNAITKYNEQQLGRDTASRKTQISMYSDPTHFIYELLQNADDYDATEIIFRLSKNELIVEHDGEPFKEENVKAITYFGKSTSADDLIKTGMFGVGFKSVFAFTATPIVISGDEHFQIYGLYRIEEYPFPDSFCRSRTRIVLPFNHESEKPDYVDKIITQEDAYSKIEDRLVGLNMDTLLFTQNIREIRWEVEGRSGHYLREDKIDKSIRHTTIMDDEKRLNEYRVFSRIPRWKDQEHKAVEIAFVLDKEGQIEPPENDCLHVLFATTQETHLQFILNGPYRTNPSRETISEEDSFNKHLMTETGSLMESVLPQIRDQGLLTTQFLSVLPNTQDKLRGFYTPLRDVILKTFHEQELVPTDDNQHVSADHVYQGPEQLRKVITKKELSFFVDKDDVSWAKGVQSNSRAGKFLSSLEIPHWVNKEFLNALDDKFSFHKITNRNRRAKQKAQDWLKRKNDDWLRDFYLLLDVVSNKEEREDLLPELRIIRTESNELMETLSNDIYLPTEGVLNGNYTTVKKALFTGLEKGPKDKLEAFFERIGVKKMRKAKAILESVYKNDSYPSEEDHKQHIHSFIKDFKEHRNIDSFTADLLDSEYKIFRDESGEYHAPSSCYLDTPFSETGLNALYCQKYQKKFGLWAQYKDIPGFEGFAQALGVQSALEIKKSSTDNNPEKESLQVDVIENHAKNTKTKIDDDYIIDDIENILRCQDIGVAKFVWDKMCRSDAECQKATFQPNKQRGIKIAPSQLIHYLRSIPWIPNKDKEFFLPEEVSKDDLFEGFNYDNSNGWLKTIGFKVDEPSGRHISEEQFQEYEELKKQKEQRSKDKGEGENPTKAVITPSKIDTPDEFIKVFNRKGKTEIQEAITDGGKVINPSHRRTKNNEGYNEDLDAEPTPDKRRKTTRRTILEEPNEQVRTFLAQLYGGKCQICNKTFPQRNGRPFFVANYMIPRRFARYVDNSANALCLCANHFAKWQHGAVDANNILDQLHSFKTEKESDGEHRPPILRIKLCGKDCEITFKEKHLLDLQELLRASANHE